MADLPFLLFPRPLRTTRGVPPGGGRTFTKPTPAQQQARLQTRFNQIVQSFQNLQGTVAGIDPEMRGGALSGITAGPGWFTRAELVARYAEKSGRDISGLGYYEVFGLFKLGVILQQIYFRYHRGQTRDERFRDFHLRVRGLMRAAVELAEHLG